MGHESPVVPPFDVDEDIGEIRTERTAEQELEGGVGGGQGVSIVVQVRGSLAA